MDYAMTLKKWAYDHEASIRIYRNYKGHEFNNITQNAAGHFHCMLGIYNMVADYCHRETVLHLKARGLLRQRVKYLAGIAGQDIDRWKKRMRSDTLLNSFDTLEAAATDHISGVMKDIAMVEMQINQYLTMNGCLDAETCSKVFLTYLMVSGTRRAHDILIKAFRENSGIDYGNLFEHCLIDRAEKAWKELTLLMIGDRLKGIEDYQPLDTAMCIVARKLSDMNAFTLKVSGAVEEFPENYSEEQRGEIHADAEKVRRHMEETEKRHRQETAAARRKQEKLIRHRRSTDITEEDLQKLKEKFTA